MTWPPSLRLMRALALAAAMGVAPIPAGAQQEVKIGIGYGIGFLPIFIADELGLVEKHAKTANLHVRATYQRFSGSGAMQDAVLLGSIDIGVYGLPAMLIAWEKGKSTRQQILGIAGVTTLPLILIANRPNIKSVKDFLPTDRIAMPSIVSPQMYALQMAVEKEFGSGQHNKLRPLVVALPHPEAINRLLSGTSEVAAYFSSAPFTQIALKNPKISKVLVSSEIFGGKVSFLVAGASKRFLDINPKMAGVITTALDEAVALIKNNPKRAAEIYLRAEPSQPMDAAAIEALLREIKDDFGVSVHGVKTYSNFMQRLGQLKNPPANWKDIFVATLHGTNSD